MKIGIAIVATNAYFVLGIKFVRRFMHFYKGDSEIVFYFFSETNPKEYVNEKYNVEFRHDLHKNWRDGTNSKFTNLLRLKDEDIDYLFYFDADTQIHREFTEDWFIGEMVGGEHFGNRSWMKENKAFDRNPKSKSYVPKDTHLPEMYYYGAFFGGSKLNMMNFCNTLLGWQLEDKKIGYEPGVNDESYINAYFHYNRPQTVYLEQFEFMVSDKGGIGETRNVSLDVSDIKRGLKENRDAFINIYNGKLEVYENSY